MTISAPLKSRLPSLPPPDLDQSSTPQVASSLGLPPVPYPSTSLRRFPESPDNSRIDIFFDPKRRSTPATPSPHPDASSSAPSPHRPGHPLRYSRASHPRIFLRSSRDRSTAPSISLPEFGNNLPAPTFPRGTPPVLHPYPILDPSCSAEESS